MSATGGQGFARTAQFSTNLRPSGSSFQKEAKTIVTLADMALSLRAAKGLDNPEPLHK